MATVVCLLLVAADPAVALPIGFGRNQADLEYSEITGGEFLVYFDRDTPEEGRFTYQALGAARPHVERWLGIKRQRPLPVILSAVTANASFANFITDALEIQTMGQVGDGGGTRALVWHEYTHNMMYRHLDNVFGPPGAILHLPWMPVWFIEGLAETTSVSVGSDFQASVERLHALTGKWPSYERMHSLYGSDFSTRGYAAAGAFVRWILQTHGADGLPAMLARFRSRSMPWWWPWAAVPGNGFMPMDDSLAALDRSSKGGSPRTDGSPDGDLLGRRLYGEYTAAATESHRRADGQNLLTGNAAAEGARVMNGGLLEGMRQGLYQDTVAQKGWLTGFGPATKKITLDSAFATTGNSGKYLQRWHLHEIKDHLVWMEQEKNVSRFCYRSRQATTPGRCPLVARFPETIDWLGTGKWPSPARQEGIFLARRTHAMTGDRDEILHWNPSRPDEPPVQVTRMATAARPVSVVQDGDDLVMLASGRHHRWLLRFSGRDGACRGMHRMTDLPVLLEPHGDGIAMAFWVPGGYVARKFRAGDLARTFPVMECGRIDPPTSPLLEAVRASARGEPDLSFTDAIKRASADSDPKPSPSTDAPLASPSPPIDNNDAAIHPARWRPRSVLAFPWIGADDALGPQIGVVSVPLMDHMQNETVRATFLVGVNSRFPNTDLRILSNRFKPTLSAAIFRQQTYNGIMPDAPGSDLYGLSYLDEKGVRLDAETAWAWDNGGRMSAVELQTGIKRSELKPYLGPDTTTAGALTEVSVGVSQATRYAWRRLVVSHAVSGRVAPDALNDVFDYNALAAQSAVSFDPGLFKSRLGLGIEGSRTRGKARRELQEVYRPLKTFVPGSGGGLQQNSFPVTGEGWLFAGRYGDSQARVKADWTLPLVEDFEKLLWIFYVDRLDFTAFLNYGGAWRGATPPASRLFGAHGYNLDLQLDNKGVRFNVGGGIGQVFSRPWESYLTLGFDALF